MPVAVEVEVAVDVALDVEVDVPVEALDALGGNMPVILLSEEVVAPADVSA
jgi:hypothetical protein